MAFVRYTNFHMQDFRQKQKMRKFMYSKVTLGALCLLLIGIMWNTWDIYQKERTARAILEEAETSRKELEVRADTLENDIARLETDGGVEEVVRDRYGVAKKGEEVIVLVDGDKDTDDSTEDERGWWARFKAFFTE